LHYCRALLLVVQKLEERIVAIRISRSVTILLGQQRPFDTIQRSCLDMLL
jgi:hypothetical protein